MIITVTCEWILFLCFNLKQQLYTHKSDAGNLLEDIYAPMHLLHCIRQCVSKAIEMSDKNHSCLRHEDDKY